jgi:hypothetical protein
MTHHTGAWLSYLIGSGMSLNQSYQIASRETFWSGPGKKPYMAKDSEAAVAL